MPVNVIAVIYYESTSLTEPTLIEEYIMSMRREINPSQATKGPQNAL